MKGLKMSFAAIIAILAIGVTIAAQAGAFEVKKSKLVSSCYEPNFTVKTGCVAATRLITPTSLCGAVALQDHVFALSANTIDPLDCDGTRLICCIELQADPTPCVAPNPAQPNVTVDGVAGKYRVSAIFCKP